MTIPVDLDFVLEKCLDADKPASELQDVSLSNQLLAIGKDCAKHLSEDCKVKTHGEILFADDGSPN